MARPVQVKMCRGSGSPILNCVGTVKETEFYNSWNNLEGNKVCYCMKCCDKILKYYEDKGCDKQSAYYYTLQKLDIPFIEEIYKNLSDKRKMTLKNYINEVQSRKERKESWNDFSSSDKIEYSNKEQEDQNKKLDDLEEIWGIQDSEKDYVFLEKTYERYTKGVEFINPQQKDLYRDLCRDRLLLRKINDGRYGGEETIDKVQNRISKTMATLKVDQFEVNKPKSLSEQLIFDKIAQIEMTKPADLYKEPTKYKDFNQVRKYYQDICLRPLKNTLAGLKDFNIDVENLQQYEIEEDNGGDNE